MKLTQERLKELLDYDYETGIFINKIDRGKAKKGNIAGTIMKDGYIRIKINCRLFLAHRLAFLYMEGYIPENEVDHIDRNPSNNKWNNLRESSHSCNMRNKCIMKNNISGINGVSWYKPYKKWVAYIVFNSKTKNLGYFDNLIDAAKARWEAEIKYNFPNCNTTSSAYLYLKDHGIL